MVNVKSGERTFNTMSVIELRTILEKIEEEDGDIPVLIKSLSMNNRDYITSHLAIVEYIDDDKIFVLTGSRVRL